MALSQLPQTWTNAGTEDSKGDLWGLEGNLFVPVILSAIVSIVFVFLTLIFQVQGPFWAMFLLWFSPTIITLAVVVLFFNKKPPRYLQDWWANLTTGPHFWHGPGYKPPAKWLLKLSAWLSKLPFLGSLKSSPLIHPLVLSKQMSKKAPLILLVCLAGVWTSGCSSMPQAVHHVTQDDGLVHDPIVVNQLSVLVKFEPGTDHLNYRSVQDIEAAAEIIRRYPNPEIRLVGHADDFLDPHKCLVLSEQRAIAVMDWMRVNTRAIVSGYAGYGDRQPIKAVRGAPENRRVEIFIWNR